MSAAAGPKQPAQTDPGLATHHPQQALLGIALVVLATACFATLDTTTKLLTASVPMAMAMWFRFTFQAVITTAFVLPQKGWRGLKTAHPKFQLARGLLLASSSALAFLSLKFTPVAEFTAIISLTPLVITMVAAWQLKEPVSVWRWLLVVGGFVGTLIIVRPSSDDFNWGMLLTLALVGTSTGFQLLTSRLSRTEDPAVTHLYTGWIGSIAATLALPFFWQPLASSSLWLALVLIGILGTVGHFVLIMAYKKTTPAVLTPYMYAQVVFAMLGGWIVFSQIPDAWSLVGILMITLCGALGTWLTVREARARGARLSERLTPEPIEA